MGLYKISSIGTVSYKKYKVIRVIARKQRSFFASLLCSSKDIQIIFSEESPLCMDAYKTHESKLFWKINEEDFTHKEIDSLYTLIEDNLDKYETIKAKKIAERKRIEEEKKAQEKKTQREKEESTLDQFLKKAKVETVSISNFLVSDNEDCSFSQQMSAIASNVNLCFTSGNKRTALDYMVQLYNKVHGYNSHKLKTISAKDGQTIGLAFIKMALYFDNGDFQANEIAAQNAYYSIAKNYLETNNTYALPALFTLFSIKPQTLFDELYSINPDPELNGLGGLVPSASYSRQSRAIKNRLPIMKFMLDKFYDENSNKYLLDPTLPYHIPSVDEIKKFLSEFKSSNYAADSEISGIGSAYFTALYENIEEQLNL